MPHPNLFYIGLALSANANSMNPLIFPSLLILIHPTGGAKTKSLSLIEFVGLNKIIQLQGQWK